MAHDVFISYASHDKPIADAVCSALEGVRFGVGFRPAISYLVSCTEKR